MLTWTSAIYVCNIFAYPLHLVSSICLSPWAFSHYVSAPQNVIYGIEDDVTDNIFISMHNIYLHLERIYQDQQGLACSITSPNVSEHYLWIDIHHMTSIYQHERQIPASERIYPPGIVYSTTSVPICTTRPPGRNNAARTYALVIVSHHYHPLPRYR